MKTILYFIADPTDEQIALAKTHQMAIRNPNAYSASDYIEQCDAVYGDVPQAYLDKFPVFELSSEEKTPKPKQPKGQKDDPKDTE